MSMVRVKSVLFAAFFLSGCSGLIYQTVWVRMLTRYLGATSHATATVLVVFMAGLALGSLLAGRFADRVQRPWRVYGLIELAIGLTALIASFVVIEGVGGFYVQVYDWFGQTPWLLLAARVLFVLVCLLLPTILMGATLPLMVAYITRQGQHLQSSLGWLYAVNTYGAVVGVLAAGFVLLGALGESMTLAIAAGLNLVAGLLAFGMAKAPDATETPASAPSTDAEAITPYPEFTRKLALVTIFVSGLGALAYEILWSRLLVLLLETSIYAFSIMLGTFLVGIAWGSWDSTRHGRLKQRPLAWFGLLEVLIGLWAAVGLLLLPLFHEWWINVERTEMESLKPVIGILACVAMVLPVSFCFGLQFPVAVRSCLAHGNQPGKSTSWAYTMNTLGTIVGSVLAGFILLPYLGTAVLMMLVAGLNVVLGLVLLGVTPKAERGDFMMKAVLLSGMFLITAVLAGDPYHRAMVSRVHSYFGEEGTIYAEYEGASATTVAAGNPNTVRKQTLLINGVGMTVKCTETKLMAHLPYLLAEKPQRMLIICFGMGTTFRSAVMNYPKLHVDVVDIVPEVFKCFKHYHKDAAEVRKQPNGHQHADDGRNFLLTHREAYDVITIDPAPPLHSAGTVNLYTKEFFALCKSRLTPGGVLCMWLPPAPEPEMLMIMKSFHEVFPEGSLWGALEFQGFYLIGGHRAVQPAPTQRKVLYSRLSQISDLGEWTKSYTDPAQLENLYLLGGKEFGRLVKDVPAVTDDKPYTEFPFWRQMSYPPGAKDYVADDVRKRLAELRGP